jgi:hypothetical protein
MPAIRSGGSGDEGIKLTPEGDDAGRPISIVRRNKRLELGRNNALRLEKDRA